MKNHVANDLAKLTKSEEKILYALTDGATSKQVALQFGVGERTIEKHRSHIIQKLGLDGKANSLTKWALINRDELNSYLRFTIITLILLCTSISSQATTIVVDSTSNSGVGSLRQAVIDANSGDTILFSTNINGDTIKLNSEIAIYEENLVIIGNDTTNTIIDAQEQSRIFNIYGSATINHLKLINGISIRGGAIYALSGATLSLSNVVVADCQTFSSSDGGGAIYAISNTTLQLSYCTFRNNYTSNRGGAIVCDPSQNVEISNCTFTHNTGSLGGAMYFRFSDTVLISNCTINHNIATASGGAFNIDGISNFRIEDSDISFNQSMNASFDGGGAFAFVQHALGTSYIENCTILNNTTNGEGGGIYTEFIDLIIRSSRISGNSAISKGGGIYNYNGSVQILNSAVSGNKGLEGGGIWHEITGSEVRLLTIWHSTVAGNEATFAFGGIGRPVFPGAVIQLNNSIVAHNIGPSLPLFANIYPPLYIKQPSQYNLIEVYTPDQSEFDNTNQIGTVENPIDPLFIEPVPMIPSILGDLRLQCVSPAVNGGNPDTTGLNIDSLDIAGKIRINLDTIDVGANEYYDPLGSALYVDSSAQKWGDGFSWNSPLTTLEEALTYIEVACTPIDSILIAEGTYYPTATEDRTISHVVNDSISIFGGFSPTEGITTFEERNWTAYPTIISGDIDRNQVLDNMNAHSPMEIYGDGLLDGLIFEHGYSEINVSDPRGRGGGLFFEFSNATVQNCIFRNNYARIGGGAYLRQGDPTLINCLFFDNEALQESGGLSASSNSHASLINCTFTENTAPANRYAIRIAFTPNMSLTNCVFWNNTGGDLSCYDGGSGTITNCMFEDSSHSACIIDNEGNHLATDPQFVNSIENNFHIKSCSPAINAGTTDTTGLNLTTVDLSGTSRIQGDTIDIGAYERSKGPVNKVTNITNDGPGSLREIIEASCTNEMVQFDPSLLGQTIGLSGAEITLGKNLHIQGLGMDQLYISGNDNSRIFKIEAGNIIKIEDINLKEGHPLDGVILNGGTLEVKGVKVEK